MRGLRNRAIRPFAVGIAVMLLGICAIPLAIVGAFYGADFLTHLLCSALGWAPAIADGLTVPVALAILFAIWKTGIIRIKVS